MRADHPREHAQARARWRAQAAERRRQFWRPVRAWAICFAAMFATDLAWSWYVAAVTDADALRAAGWAVALFLLGAVAVRGYVQNPWLLIPAAAGAFAGTWAGVAYPF